MAVWTARVAKIDGRQVIIVNQHGFYYATYGSVEEMQAALAELGVDLADVELRG